MELENLGRSLSMITEVNDGAVALTCFGEFEPFDEVGKRVYKSTAGESLGSGVGRARVIQPESEG
jgi:hypothetical protein